MRARSSWGLYWGEGAGGSDPQLCGAGGGELALAWWRCVHAVLADGVGGMPCLAVSGVPSSSEQSQQSQCPSSTSDVSSHSPDEASERMGRALGPSAGRASTRRGAGEEPSGDEGELSAPAWAPPSPRASNDRAPGPVAAEACEANPSAATPSRITPNRPKPSPASFSPSKPSCSPSKCPGCEPPCPSEPSSSPADRAPAAAAVAAPEAAHQKRPPRPEHAEVPGSSEPSRQSHLVRASMSGSECSWRAVAGQARETAPLIAPSSISLSSHRRYARLRSGVESALYLSYQPSLRRESGTRRGSDSAPCSAAAPSHSPPSQM